MATPRPSRSTTTRTGVDRQDLGFTLIELLIVIVILGILATVVVFAVGGITDRGSDSAQATDERTLATAEETHYAQFGSYTDEAGLVAAGLLRDESDLHDISLAGGDYTIVYVGGGGGGPLAQFGSGSHEVFLITGGSATLLADWNDYTANCAPPAYTLNLVVDASIDLAWVETTVESYPPLVAPDPPGPGVGFFADPSTPLGAAVQAGADPNLPYIYPYVFGNWGSPLSDSFGCPPPP